jgi:hypothetical protein
MSNIDLLYAEKKQDPLDKLLFDHLAFNKNQNFRMPVGYPLVSGNPCQQGGYNLQSNNVISKFGNNFF